MNPLSWPGNCLRDSLAARFSRPEATERRLDGLNEQPQDRERTTRALLARALKRARGSLFWERLWPALAALATALGLFLAFSWAGLWLVLPPLARAIGLFVFVVIAAAAAVPLLMLRLPEHLRRLAPARPQQRREPPAGDRGRRRDRRQPARSDRAGALARPCRARVARRRASSRPAGRSRSCRCAIRWRCARWCCCWWP